MLSTEIKRAHKCDTCLVRIPKSHRNLICSICGQFKHYKCQKLNKNDVESILKTPGYRWSCYDCISAILPVNACSNRTKAHSIASKTQFKILCYACQGMSYSKTNVSECTFCNNTCHKKCIKGTLGCIKCCDELIPGNRCFAYELLDIDSRVNSTIYNPYNRHNLINSIGDQIRGAEENNEAWGEISEKLCDCKYRSPQEIHRTRDDELGLLSLNIRSISKNLTLIKDNIHEYDKYDVIALNETNCNISKLPNGEDDLLIDGFNPPVYQAPARTSCKGGGLLTYVHKRVCNTDDIEPISLGHEPSTSAELLAIKIRSCKKSNNTVIVVSIYRSPSSHNTSNFMKIFDESLNRLRGHSRKHILLAGDTNIDLLKYENDDNSQNLINTAATHGFAQLISRPTRVTDHSCTLIDHIFSNKVHKVIDTSVLSIDLSDHLGTYVRISLDPSFDRAIGHGNPSYGLENHNNRKQDYRIFNEANNDTFKDLLKNETWQELDGLGAEDRYEKFNEIYMKHYESAYPLKSQRQRRKNERADPKPWITPWLEDAFNRKNTLYRDYVTEPTIQNKAVYEKMQKFCKIHKNKAKIRYYKKYFDEHSENSRKQWQLINSLLNRNKKKASINKLVDKEGNVASSPSEISETFNEYFSNIARNLKSKISVHEDTRSYEAFLNDPVPLTIFLRPADNSEVSHIIKKLKNKSTQDTKISALKIAGNDTDFVTALAQTVTLSLEEGVFPQALKIARVVPIFKSGKKTDVSNYRPISLLATFSKIYEKVMHARIVDFLEKNSSIYERQYGFRAGRSCEHALLDAQNTLLNSLNRKQISILLLIDFSKAFDLVDHEILLKKLNHYGIRGIAQNWLKSYLTNRKQFVSVNGSDSSVKHMQFGVPQGSILGPLLFVIYINDLPGISNLANFILYADDANIIISGENIYEVEEQLDRLTGALVEWVNANGLLLSLKKTNFMLFSRHNIKQSPIVSINNVQISRVHEAKFLGVILDEKLTWASHIKALKVKMARYVGIMYRIRTHLPLSVRVQIYHSFVQSHLNFCSLVWGFAAKAHINSLFAQQKKGMRAVMPGHVNYFYKDGILPSGTKSSFNSLAILTVHGIIASNTANFMNKIFNFPDQLPKYVQATIPEDAPSRMLGIDHESCYTWSDNYNTNI